MKGPTSTELGLGVDLDAGLARADAEALIANYTVEASVDNDI